MFTRIYEANEIRLSIKCYEQYKSYRKASDLTGISKSSIHRWYTKFHNILKIRSKFQKRKKRSVTKLKFPSLVDDLKRIFLASKTVRFISLQEILNNLKYQKKPSLSWICKVLKKIKISRRRFQKLHHVTGVNIKSLDEKDLIFANKIIHIRNEEIVCIDETGFCNIGNAFYGYFEKGKNPDNINVKKREKYSTALAISIEGLIDFKHQQGAFTTNDFLMFLKSIIPKLTPTIKYILMDNINFHHSKIIIEYLKSCNLEALFITAYTPREDPIEEFISMVKKSFREEYINSNNFSKSIDTAFNKCLQLNTLPYYNHMREFVEKKLKRKLLKD